MPASLNIKNPETHRLAEELAKLTGESMATAVQTALRERLERMQHEDDKEARLRRVRAIVDDIASHQSPEALALDIDEFLYDERGLPK